MNEGHDMTSSDGGFLVELSLVHLRGTRHEAEYLEGHWLMAAKLGMCFEALAWRGLALFDSYGVVTDWGLWDLTFLLHFVPAKAALANAWGPKGCLFCAVNTPGTSGWVCLTPARKRCV